MDKLFASLGFTICAFVFILFVVIVYISKNKNKKTGSKIFSTMGILTISLLINEFLYVYAMYAELDGKFLFIKTRPLCYSYILLSIIWFVMLILYIWIIAKKNTSEITKKEKIYMSIGLISLVLIMFLISTVLKLEYPTSNSNLYVFSGPAVYTLYIVGIVVLTVVIVAILRSGDSIPKYQKYPIYFCILTLIGVNAFQLISNYDFNTLSFLYAFVVITLYFTIESQDYRLVDELDKKKNEAEIADKAQTEFLANMSHEIRTPLNTILGFSNSILSQKRVDKTQIKKDLTMINSASNTLLELINNILDISRVESGKEKIEEKEYNIQSLIDDINDFMDLKLNKDTLEFIVDVDKNVPKAFLGDYVKVYKSTMFVLYNALKYTNYGNITLKISGETLENEMFNLSIVIANTGHEMSNENFEVDFNDFVKIGNGNQNNIDNQALGLIIAKKYINMLNGEISFANKKGEGTKYFINLPQKIASNEKIGKVTKDITKSFNNKNILDCSGKRILIVDDNDLNLKLACRLLETYKFKIDKALSGQECIEMVKASKYDIIFLDHMMPGMDGIETFKMLEKIENFKTPVIALTANSESGLRDNYISIGFFDYLSKPINIKELNNMIERIIFKK